MFVCARGKRGPPTLGKLNYYKSVRATIVTCYKNIISLNARIEEREKDI
jgi:hypothetical protein